MLYFITMMNTGLMIFLVIIVLRLLPDHLASCSDHNHDHHRHQPHVEHHHHRQFSPREGLFNEEENRLGSTPPSCHNKCNQCHPCMAVQVPSAHNDGQPPATRTVNVGVFDPSSQGNSNYKPLSWKCRCGNRLFNP